MNHYDTYYVVRIISSPNDKVWYATRLGKEYEASKEKYGNTFRFKLGYLHYLPPEHCVIVHIMKKARYTK